MMREAAIGSGRCTPGLRVGHVRRRRSRASDPSPGDRAGRMSRTIPLLADFRRIVVKVGSSLLVDAEAGRVKEAWLASLAADIAKLHAQGREILVVSSGAIALGRAVLRLPKGALKLEERQAAAPVGEIALPPPRAEGRGKAH